MSSTAKLVRKVLVLLDMNGTLLYRSKVELERPPSFVFHTESDESIFYYLRPGATEIVHYLLQHPKVNVAFYTSMRWSNALPAVQRIMQDTTSTHFESIIYDGKFNVPLPSGPYPWSVKRNLKLIWETEGKIGFGFNETNSLMIDDTEYKICDYPLNFLLVKEFSENEVQNGDTELFELIEILRRILDTEVSDIRDAIVNFTSKADA